MSNLLSELDAVVGLADKATPGPWESASRGRYYVGQQQDEASVHGADDSDIDEVSNVAPLHEANTIRGDCYLPDADLIAAAVNFLRTHHAEITAAVRDAAYGCALIDAMNCEYQAAKESRKGGKQKAWITTYMLLRRIKVAADKLTDMGIPITEQDQPLAAMSAREGE